LRNTRCRSTDVERTHGKLRTWLTDGLRGNHAHGLATLDQPARCQVAAVAGDADTALGLAGQYRADLHALDTGRLNQARKLLGDLLIHADDQVAFEIALVFERHAANNAVTQRLNDFSRFDDRLDKNAFRRAAIVFGNDDVLRNIHQAACQIAGI